MALSATNIPVCFTGSLNMSVYGTKYFTRYSVVTRCGGILNKFFITNLLENLLLTELWKSVDLTKLWPSVWCNFWPTLYSSAIKIDGWGSHPKQQNKWFRIDLANENVSCWLVMLRVYVVSCRLAWPVEEAKRLAQSRGQNYGVDFDPEAKILVSGYRTWFQEFGILGLENLISVLVTVSEVRSCFSTARVFKLFLVPNRIE